MSVTCPVDSWKADLESEIWPGLKRQVFKSCFDSDDPSPVRSEEVLWMEERTQGSLERHGGGQWFGVWGKRSEMWEDQNCGKRWGSKSMGSEGATW
jgi:hypothetical protein